MNFGWHHLKPAQRRAGRATQASEWEIATGTDDCSWLYAWVELMSSSLNHVCITNAYVFHSGTNSRNMTDPFSWSQPVSRQIAQVISFQCQPGFTLWFERYLFTFLWWYWAGGPICYGRGPRPFRWSQEISIEWPHLEAVGCWVQADGALATPLPVCVCWPSGLPVLLADWWRLSSRIKCRIQHGGACEREEAPYDGPYNHDWHTRSEYKHTFPDLTAIHL